MICPKCSYYWKARVENPVACPSCKVRIKEFLIQCEIQTVHDKPDNNYAKTVIEATIDNIKIGSVVRLKTGSPKMTIVELFNDKMCKCYWFVDRTLNEREFNIEHLVIEPLT